MTQTGYFTMDEKAYGNAQWKLLCWTPLTIFYSAKEKHKTSYDSSRSWRIIQAKNKVLQLEGLKCPNYFSKKAPKTCNFTVPLASLKNPVRTYSSSFPRALNVQFWTCWYSLLIFLIYFNCFLIFIYSKSLSIFLSKS